MPLWGASREERGNISVKVILTQRCLLLLAELLNTLEQFLAVKRFSLFIFHHIITSRKGKKEQSLNVYDF